VIDDETKKQHRLAMDRYEQLRQAHAALIALFQWYDGPLITAMRQGDMLMIDEVFGFVVVVRQHRWQQT
jgi:midasin (ATPase involved in ribosome maturation)